MEKIITQGTTETFKEESVVENQPTQGTTETHKTEVVEYMEKNNEILNDARFIVNTYIDNFQTVVYGDYNYPYPHYGCTVAQYDEMVADMKKDFEEILNNFKEVAGIFLNTYKEYEDIVDYPNEKTKAYDIVEDIDLSIDLLIDYHNGKKDSSALRILIETYVKCNLYIDKLNN